MARPVSVEFLLTGNEIEVSTAETPAKPVDAADTDEAFRAAGNQPTEPDASSVGAVPWIVGGIGIVVLLAAGTWAVRRRRQGGSDSV